MGTGTPSTLTRLTWHKIRSGSQVTGAIPPLAAYRRSDLKAAYSAWRVWRSRTSCGTQAPKNLPATPVRRLGEYEDKRALRAAVKVAADETKAASAVLRQHLVWVVVEWTDSPLAHHTRSAAPESPRLRIMLECGSARNRRIAGCAVATLLPAASDCMLWAVVVGGVDTTFWFPVWGLLWNAGILQR